jgi:hypothetical protein
MLPLTSGGSSFTVALANEQGTERLVTDIAAALEPGQGTRVECSFPLDQHAEPERSAA